MTLVSSLKLHIWKTKPNLCTLTIALFLVREECVWDAPIIDIVNLKKKKESHRQILSCVDNHIIHILKVNNDPWVNIKDHFRE